MPAFIPVHPPRNPDECPAWLHEAIKRLNRHATNSAQSFAAIIRGEAPDGSGFPILDFTKFFYKPGLPGGQVAFFGLNAGEGGTLSSTAAAGKGKIYLGSARASAYDEANDYLGIGISTPSAKIHVTGPTSGTFGYPASDFSIQLNRSGGSSNASCLDEETESDSDYVVFDSFPNAALSDFYNGQPFTYSGTATGFILRWAEGPANNASDVRQWTALVQIENTLGGVLAGPWSYSHNTDGTVFTHAETLSDPECVAVLAASSAYRIKVQLSYGGGGLPTSVGRVYWVRLEIQASAGTAVLQRWDLGGSFITKINESGRIVTTLAPQIDIASATANWPLVATDSDGNTVFLNPASLPTRAQHRWTANGPYQVDTNVDGGFIAATAMTISSVWLHRTTAGTSSSTILDLNKNGVTMYTTQANRPTIAFNDSDNKVQATLPDIVSVAAGDILTIDIDQIEGGTPQHVSLIIEGA